MYVYYYFPVLPACTRVVGEIRLRLISSHFVSLQSDGAVIGETIASTLKRGKTMVLASGQQLTSDEFSMSTLTAPNVRIPKTTVFFFYFIDAASSLLL